MTINKIESVLGVVRCDFGDIARILKKIDEKKYGKYINFEKTADSIRQNDWPEDSDYPTLLEEILEDLIAELTDKIVHKVISFEGVDFRVFRYPHDTDTGQLVFGFVISSIEPNEASCRSLEGVLKKVEVLRTLIDDDDSPTFHTIPDDCSCCS